MADTPTLHIPADVINPIIQAQIHSAIAQAIGAPQILQRAIETVLSTKVNEHGQVDNSAYRDRGRPWIEWAVGDALKKATTAAIDAAVVLQQDAIKKELARQLSQKNSPLVRSLVEAIVKGAFDPARLKYRMTISAFDD